MRGTLLVGRYRLTAHVGSGGMGTVWQAQDLRLGRTVAVKTMTDFADAIDSRRLVMRFGREARLAAGLSSPHIVTVHDYGEATVGEQTVLYLVMELLRGRPLDRLLQEAQPSLAEAADWGRQICSALTVAHQAGVVHRDLKPGNVVVGEDGVVTVLDFGIARSFASEDETWLTTAGVAIGTPAYMSPEQVRGERTLDARSDLYSLGCLLYAMVTGEPPFPSGSLYEMFQNHLNRDPDPPSRKQPNVPREWDELILRLLHKHPDQRPTSAVEVREALTAVPTTPPTSAVPDTSAPTSPASRRPESRTPRGTPVPRAVMEPRRSRPTPPVRRPQDSGPVHAREPKLRAHRPRYVKRTSLVLAVLGLAIALFYALKPAGDGETSAEEAKRRLPALLTEAQHKSVLPGRPADWYSGPAPESPECSRACEGLLGTADIEFRKSADVMTFRVMAYADADQAHDGYLAKVKATTRTGTFSVDARGDESAGFRWRSRDDMTDAYEYHEAILLRTGTVVCVVSLGGDVEKVHTAVTKALADTIAIRALDVQQGKRPSARITVFPE